ncbi:Ro-like RNA binding protein [Streptomyces phage Beuffert]|nr:Ro-like RNA binding protein [Streptomyces phage Beuffert]
MKNSLGKYAASQKAERTSTPQTKRTPGRTDEVKNNAGGFTFQVNDKTRLERFLILGTDKGTYYVKEQKLTAQNVDFVRELIRKDERMVVDTVVDVSVNGRAAKNSPALFTMALVMAEGQDKAYAREAVTKVARTSTHLFEYAQYIDDLGGWGRAKRQSVAGWYEGKDADSLAYQAVKYRQRNGWTHRDLFRLSHPKGVDEKVGKFILNGEVSETSPLIIEGFSKMQKAKSVKDVLDILEQFPYLPWETIPTQFLTDAKVWQTLFYQGSLGQTALLRNVKRFAKMGAFNDMMFAGEVAKRLADAEAIRKGRVHPVSYLNALYIYTKGEFARTGWSGARSKDWTTNAKIAGALEAGFYNAFGNVEPANKRTMVSIDVSASMTWQAPAGLVGLDCREAAAAMAMVLVRSEPYVTVNAFSTYLQDAGVSDSDSLQTVMNKISRLPMGGTDCAQPMLFAAKNNIEVDTFTVWTDNETWAGRVKPFQALKQYRQQTGIDARLVVVGMEGNEFTIADPTDKGMLDVVGFDANAPGVIANFSAGRV